MESRQVVNCPSSLKKEGQDTVNFYSYRTAREKITGRLETKAAKQLEKMRLEKATKKKNGGGADGAAESD